MGGWLGEVGVGLGGGGGGGVWNVGLKRLRRLIYVTTRRL